MRKKKKQKKKTKKKKQRRRKKKREGRVLEERKEGAKNLRDKFEREKKNKGSSVRGTTRISGYFFFNCLVYILVI